LKHFAGLNVSSRLFFYTSMIQTVTWQFLTTQRFTSQLQLSCFCDVFRVTLFGIHWRVRVCASILRCCCLVVNRVCGCIKVTLCRWLMTGVFVLGLHFDECSRRWLMFLSGESCLLSAPAGHHLYRTDECLTPTMTRSHATRQLRQRVCVVDEWLMLLVRLPQMSRSWWGVFSHTTFSDITSCCSVY
jgi:putative copper export protein